MTNMPSSINNKWQRKELYALNKKKHQEIFLWKNGLSKHTYNQNYKYELKNVWIFV